MSTEERIRFFHHRWSAPVLVELERERGTRFVLLVNRLGVSRTVLRATLDSLIDLGYVRRNPGYGHPLRPEYVLTARGHAVARRCAQLLESLPDPKLALRKWTLPVLAAMGVGARFSELQGALPGVTPRALAQALRDLQAVGLADRAVLDGYPPSTLYRPTARGLVAQRLIK